MDIERQLSQHAMVGLDTSIFIYHLEANQRYLPLTTAVLNGVQSGQWPAFISTLVLMELTVHPWRLGRPAVARRYEALLVHFPHLALVDATRAIARRAAQLRARYNLRPADALHVATAVNSGATAYVTNDKQLARLKDRLEIILLDEFLT